MLPFSALETDPKPAKRPLPTRERLIRAATRLFQQRGYYAAGTAEILAEAKAPRGSLYHHFPGGKSELACAAIEWLTAEIVEAVRTLRLSGRKPGSVIQTLGEGMAGWLKRTGWAEGSLLMVLTNELAPSDASVSAALQEAYGTVQAEFAQMLEVGGMNKQDALDRAAAIIAALEGGMVLSRALQDDAPLRAAIRPYIQTD